MFNEHCNRMRLLLGLERRVVENISDYKPQQMRNIRLLLVNEKLNTENE